MGTRTYVDASEVRDLATDLAEAPAKVDTRAGLVVEHNARATARTAESLAPVFTGALKDSIHVEIDGLASEVVAGTDHAEYVEDGTSVMAPQPFMRPAAERQAGPLVRDLEDIIGDFL